MSMFNFKNRITDSRSAFILRETRRRLRRRHTVPAKTKSSGDLHPCAGCHIGGHGCSACDFGFLQPRPQFADCAGIKT